MAIALNNKIQQWSGRVQSSQAGVFFRWWSAQLKALMPKSWQQRLQYAQRRVTLRQEPDQLRIGIQESGSNQWFGSIPSGSDAVLQRQQIKGLLEQKDALEAPQFLLMDAGHVLRKELKLPAAAESNLLQVLAFEMDRQTPFRAADVYYTWKMLDSENDPGQIRLELYVAPRKPIDAILESLAARGLAVSGVDVFNENAGLGVNLLPPEKRHRAINARTRLNIWLAGVALFLLVLVMAESLSYRAGQLSELEAAIADVQDEAKLVQQLKEQVVETGEAASFLTRRRAATPMAIEVLADVTSILPDDTYLDRLVINGDGVLLQGKSHNAQQLIEVINKSAVLENAEFRGSTRLDAGTGLEIFEVGATLETASAP